jgi:cytidine deaminase
MQDAMHKTVDNAGLQQLIDAALRVAENSYSPYSNFRVGSAILLSNGAVVTGTNVENVSYGLTFCAERSALVRAVAEFGPGIKVKAVAVANLNDAASAPCGACRQMLAEFTDPDAPVIFPAEEGMCVMRLCELLPCGFYLERK